MTFNQIETGLMKYIQNEIAAKAQGPMKFIIYTGTFLGTIRFEEMFNQYKDHPLIKSLGVIGENEEIDVETLYSAMKRAMETIGTFEYMGIKFNMSDVDSLYNYIRRG